MEIYKGEKYYPSYHEATSDVSAVAFGVMRLSDGYWYDFADGTFKDSSWVTQYQSLTEDANGLWVYTTGWTSPNTTGQYRIQYKITDLSGTFYAGGEEINVKSISPLVHTTIATPTTTADMLIAINSAIAARLTGGAVQEYTIGGRNLKYITLPELYNLRKAYMLEQASEHGGMRNYINFKDPA
jgi:hypothetical protein